MTQTVTSADGTRIAYESSGAGPDIVLVDGSFEHREFGMARPLAAELVSEFTVHCYDRRGRGGSGDTPPSTIDRELEDLDALCDNIGRRVLLYGASSGAALALEAAHRGDRVAALALYEPPFVVDDSREPVDIVADVRRAIAEDRRGDAVVIFMRAFGAGDSDVEKVRASPAWPQLTATVPTLPYDLDIVADLAKGRPLPAGRWNGATMPTLVMTGGSSPGWIGHAGRALAANLPNADYRMVSGQTHEVAPTALAPVLREFFTAFQTG